MVVFHILVKFCNACLFEWFLVVIILVYLHYKDFNMMLLCISIDDGSGTIGNLLLFVIRNFIVVKYKSFFFFPQSF